MALACDVCRSAEVFVVSPGADPEVACGITVRRGRRDRCWCEVHARAAGWPWLVSGERNRTTRQVEACP